MAPCNCGGKKASGPRGARQFVYQPEAGKPQVHGSEVQAKAAQIRAGGGGTVKPA